MVSTLNKKIRAVESKKIGLFYFFSAVAMIITRGASFRFPCAYSIKYSNINALFTALGLD